MSAILFLLLALWPNLIFSYNVDISYPIIYTESDISGPRPSGSNNSFGFSLALSRRRNSNLPANLFVGAPKSSNGEGRLYRCAETETAGTPRCKVLQLDPASDREEVIVPIVPVGYYENRTIKPGKVGWLGASMSTMESSDLTVCAPRSVIKRKYHFYNVSVIMDDMHGYCYDVRNAQGDTLYRDNNVLRHELRYRKDKVMNSLYGFSVDHALNKASHMVDRIIGQPRLDTVSIKQGRTYKPLPFNLDELSNLGYSVTSGYYFSNDKLVFVAGAPRRKSKGSIMISESPYDNPKYQDGSVFGEYFGASLTTGDFDNDGLDDIAVGAPHWGQVDFGRVYTFYGKRDGTFQPGLMLQGEVEYGQFGYTLASADLDSDGYSDLVVSAPWENSGVVYIYYGSTGFRSELRSVPVTQKIEPSAFMPNAEIERFGFALSRPVDIDQNGYPDLAIGAYKSGHAVVLRSRPVIKGQVRLLSTPPTLQKSTGSFLVHVCVEYRGLGAPATQELAFEMTVDENYRRIEGGTSKSFSDSFLLDRVYCTNYTVTLMKAYRNYVDPIMVRVQHRIKERDRATTFCPSCPVLNRESFGESPPMRVPFDTGCKGGEKCKPELTITASLGGASKDDEWVVGSGDVILNLTVRNEGDPAYQTQLTIDLPAGVDLRNGIPSCESSNVDKAIRLICQFGNPLDRGETKSLSIGLNMEGIVESVGGTVLTFNITKWTRTVDEEKDDKRTLELTVKNVAYFELTGLADEESRDYSRIENNSMVPIRHNYQVLKYGETPIFQAILTISVPIAMVGRNNSFLEFTEPKFTDSAGNSFACFRATASHLMGDSRPPESENEYLQRRRRGISNDNEEMMMSTTHSSITNDDSELRNDTNSRTSTYGVQTTDLTIYLNCSSEDVSCVDITCQFGLSKTSNDMGNVLLDVNFDANAFFTSKEDSLTIKFNTNATVEIILPFISVPDYLRNTTAEVSTLLYNIPEPQKLSGWIIPVSVVLGILLFFLLAFVLFKMGFFNRPKKAETAKAKEMEMILKTGNDGESEPYG